MNANARVICRLGNVGETSDQHLAIGVEDLLNFLLSHDGGWLPSAAKNSRVLWAELSYGEIGDTSSTFTDARYHACVPTLVSITPWPAMEQCLLRKTNCWSGRESPSRCEPKSVVSESHALELKIYEACGLGHHGNADPLWAQPCSAPIKRWLRACWW